MAAPHSHQEWLTILSELIARNGGVDQYVYVQVTRGMEFGRNHAFPPNVKPTVFALASALPVLTPELRERGLSAITVEDFRWGRCDIKTTALLANVLMKQQAEDAGVQEAIILRDGEVLEGASTSIFIVSNGVLITPPNSHRTLPGTTRDVALELATGVMPIEIRSLAEEELRNADEVWLASATRDVLPTTRIDGKPVGTGKPGPLWHAMSVAFAGLRATLAGTSAL